MNKPLISVMFLSIACCVGFIGGVLFGGFYNENIIVETISEFNKVQNLMEWHKLIIIDQMLLNDLEKISGLSDVEDLIKKYKKNGISHIELFNKQAKIIKKDAPNPTAIVELEKNVDDIEKYFKKEGKP
jgi:hypothetical protein